MGYKVYISFGQEQDKKMKGKLNSSSTSWNFLRLSDEESPFAFEKTVEQYEKTCLTHDSYAGDAKIILDKLSDDEKKIVSFGVGKGNLEWNLKNIDENITICCSDFTKETLDKLKEFFPKCDDYIQFDLKSKDYSLFSGYKAAIMYRIITEFDKKTWKDIFRKCWEAKINTIVYVPGHPSTIRRMLNNYYVHFRTKVGGGQKYLPVMPTSKMNMNRCGASTIV